MKNKTIISELNNFLKSARSVAIIGAGTELRGDDSAGIKLAEILAEEFHNSPDIAIFPAGMTPENWLGPIMKFNPTHIIIVDSADFGKTPGTIKLIQPEETDGFHFSTHGISFGILADYLIKNSGCSIIILGIQCKTLKMNEEMSQEVKSALADVVEILKECLDKLK
jgi:hydrogenase 3 maturation protease